MKIAEMSWSQVERYLERDDRCVIPLGSTEQHAHISLATDAILAERVAACAAEPLGVPVFPVLAYGITPYFMGYPGTVTIEPDTYERLLGDILESVARHGFRRVLVVNGHGGNSQARIAARRWADGRAGMLLRWHDWWKAPATRRVVDEIDPDASHASWMETFPWTRVPGIELPSGHKNPVDLTDRDSLSPGGLRERLGDGSFGGDYQRTEDEMEHLWRVAVEETRERLAGSWS